MLNSESAWNAWLQNWNSPSVACQWWCTFCIAHKPFKSEENWYIRLHAHHNCNLQKIVRWPSFSGKKDRIKILLRCVVVVSGTCWVRLTSTQGWVDPPCCWWEPNIFSPTGSTTLGVLFIGGGSTFQISIFSLGETILVFFSLHICYHILCRYY